jgi:hypothetical protein
VRGALLNPAGGGKKLRVSDGRQSLFELPKITGNRRANVAWGRFFFVRSR